MFAIVALSVSAATTVSFPQYYPPLITFRVSNPYCQYNLPQQDFAMSISQSLAMVPQQEYCPRQIT
jgi:hypothetical protein